MNDYASPNELTRLMALVRQVCPDLPPTKEILAESRFIEDLGMESLNRLMLMTLVESEFSVSLEQHMAALIELQSVGETADFIRSLKAGA